MILLYIGDKTFVVACEATYSGDWTMTVRNKELQELVKKLIQSGQLDERSRSYSSLYMDDDADDAFFTLNSFQLNHVNSHIEKARNTESLGRFVQKLAAKNGIFSYNEAFFGQAEISRPYWSKLINNNMQNPGKETILRLALLFKCDLEETHKLLAKAGYTFSDSGERDQIVFACIEIKAFDFFDIEELIASNGLKSLFSTK
jgi:transcriptional regulator with XRE-family HTH domain